MEGARVRAIQFSRAVFKAELRWCRLKTIEKRERSVFGQLDFVEKGNSVGRRANRWVVLQVATTGRLDCQS